MFDRDRVRSQYQTALATFHVGQQLRHKLCRTAQTQIVRCKKDSTICVGQSILDTICVGQLLRQWRILDLAAPNPACRPELLRAP